MTYTLRQLDAWFSRYRKEQVDPTARIDGVRRPSGVAVYYDRVETLAEVDGVWFKCPKCYDTSYPHQVLVGFEGRCPPGSYTQGSDGQDTRWVVDPRSTSLDDLRLSPSIQLIGGCNWHGFVGYSQVPPGHAEDA